MSGGAFYVKLIELDNRLFYHVIEVLEAPVFDFDRLLLRVLLFEEVPVQCVKDAHIDHALVELNIVFHSRDRFDVADFSFLMKSGGFLAYLLL